MKSNWTKYLVITAITSIVLAFIIQLSIEIVQSYILYGGLYETRGSFEVGSYGLFWILAAKISFWFFVSWITLITIKLTNSIFKGNKIKLT